MFKLKLHEDTGWISIGKYSMYRKVNGIVYVNFQETPPSVGDFVTIFTMPEDLDLVRIYVFLFQRIMLLLNSVQIL